MNCDVCGKEARPGDAFCRQCGSRLAGGEAPAEVGGETAWAPPQEETAGETAWVPPQEEPGSETAWAPGGAVEEAPPGAEAPPAAGGAPPAAALVPPAAAVTPPPPYPPPQVPRAAAAKTSGWAVASLVLGILSFLCLPFIAAVVAIVFGAIARGDIRRSRGETGGSGLATAGIVLGVVNLALLFVFAAALVPWMVINLGRTETVTRTVGAQGAQAVSATLEMDSGSIKVGGGAANMFEGTFTYNVKKWEPDIEYRVRDDLGELSVKQGGEWWVPSFWFIRNDWDIRFSGEVPLDLAATLSSGDGEFDLKSLLLRSLSVDSSSGDISADLSGEMPELRRVSIDDSSGSVDLDLTGKYATYIQMDVETSSGDVNVDLTGEWESALGATINCSSGDVTLRLPSEVGVRVRVRSRSGDVNVSGMSLDSGDEDGAVYVNGAFRRALITLQIDVEVSSGDITLLAE